MSSKALVLKVLEENRGKDISGEAIGKQLGITRGGVWKAIHSLKAEGYDIQGVSNKGYSLAAESDLLSPQGVRPWLEPNYQEIEIFAYKTVGSTNQVAKKKAVEGATHGTLIFGECQTEGRGRLGRSFFSPEETGVYMSLVLRPEIQAKDGVLITTAASVAVARAIEKVTGKKMGIKWVNDLYYKNKKVAGILTEAVTTFESDVVESIILGIGINFRTPTEAIPEEIKEKAGALYSQKPQGVIRNQLIGEVTNQILSMSENLKVEDFMKEYREKSIVLGKEIRVRKKDGWIKATAVDITEEGGLVIETQTRKQEILSSGEISIQL
ncbi:MAG: biotin--[acetyl-CoA-carboxylase] ligase [Eubacteriaceae bacterium]